MDEGKVIRTHHTLPTGVSVSVSVSEPTVDDKSLLSMRSTVIGGQWTRSKVSKSPNRRKTHR